DADGPLIPVLQSGASPSLLTVFLNVGGRASIQLLRNGQPAGSLSPCLAPATGATVAFTAYCNITLPPIVEAGAYELELTSVGMTSTRRVTRTAILLPGN
ncbi:MAG TPA: hypothetical protein VN838_25620, partial [Bradyrhizobium sp.]|nr:hypothetical protein [Bradyrhizobium sp.]